MARPRQAQYSDLPKNLIFDKVTGFYRYRNVLDGQYYQIGKDKVEAVTQALCLNAELLPQLSSPSRRVITVSSVEEETSMTFAAFLEERFLPDYLPERQLKPLTMQDYRRRLKVLKEALGTRVLSEVTTKHLADFNRPNPPYQRKNYRSILKLFFDYALGDGLCKVNPATPLIIPKLKRQRERLAFKGFQAIYAEAPQWLKNAMDLGLLTLQRREDLVRIHFSHVQEGFLYVVQEKTEERTLCARLKIQMGVQLREVVERCRNELLSPYVIHRKPERKVAAKGRTHYTQILPDYVTKEFAKVRDDLGLYDHLPMRKRPSFHEIRSLGIALYEKQGKKPKTLAGHASQAMTDEYLKGHDVWTEATADLQLTV